VRVTARVDIEGECRIRAGLVDLESGAVFGELNLFEAGVRSASVLAIEDCSLLRIDGEELSHFLEQNTDLGYRLLQHFFQVLNERLRKADQRIEGLFAWGLKAHDIERHLVDD
jgi:CRP/FNR family transcriptional regulator, cyclic AMP receptor protein